MNVLHLLTPHPYPPFTPIHHTPPNSTSSYLVLTVPGNRECVVDLDADGGFRRVNLSSFNHLTLPPSPSSPSDPIHNTINITIYTPLPLFPSLLPLSSHLKTRLKNTYISSSSLNYLLFLGIPLVYFIGGIEGITMYANQSISLKIIQISASPTQSSRAINPNWFSKNSLLQKTLSLKPPLRPRIINLIGTSKSGKTSYLKQLLNEGITLLNTLNYESEEIKGDIIFLDSCESIFDSDQEYGTSELNPEKIKLENFISSTLRKKSNTCFVISRIGKNDYITLEGFDTISLFLGVNKELYFKDKGFGEKEIEVLGNLTRGFNLRELDWEGGYKERIKRYLEITPENLRDLEIVKPSTKTFGGYSEIKQKIEQSILLPHKTKNGMDIKPPRGCLISGAAGVGKSRLGYYISSRLNYNLIVIRPSSILSKYTGGSEEILRSIFERARFIKPCCIFIPSIDVVAGRRGFGEGVEDKVKRGILTTILNEVDGGSDGEGIFVIGTCGRVEDVDEALIRIGRMEVKLHIPLPSVSDTAAIINIALEDYKLSSTLKFEEYAERILEFNWGGGGVEGFVREVVGRAEERVEGGGEEEVGEEDFEGVLRSIGV